MAVRYNYINRAVAADQVINNPNAKGPGILKGVFRQAAGDTAVAGNLVAVRLGTTDIIQHNEWTGDQYDFANWTGKNQLDHPIPDQDLVGINIQGLTQEREFRICIVIDHPDDQLPESALVAQRDVLGSRARIEAAAIAQQSANAMEAVRQAMADVASVPFGARMGK